jgi:hypothetical protein
MKGLSKIALLGALFALFTVHIDNFARGMAAMSVAGKDQAAEVTDIEEVQDNLAETVKNETEEVKKAMADFYAIESAVEVAIADAQLAYEGGEISAANKAQIVEEQNYKLAQAKDQLSQIVVQSADTVKVQEGYFDQFVSGVRGVGAGLKSLYSYSDEDKAKARTVIEQLNKDLAKITKVYWENIQKASSDEEKKELTDEWMKVNQQFEGELYTQHLITGYMTRPVNKDFWALVGSIGAAYLGLYAKAKYDQRQYDREKEQRRKDHDRRRKDHDRRMEQIQKDYERAIEKIYRESNEDIVQIYRNIDKYEQNKAKKKL